MNIRFALISFCLYMASINGLNCWSGFANSTVNFASRNFTDIPSGNLCFSFSDKTSGASYYTSGSPTQISEMKKFYDVKECPTYFCNEPPNPPPM